jgi:hypothetical protein
LQLTQCAQCIGAGVPCEPGTTTSTCKRCQVMCKACQVGWRTITVWLPPGKILKAAEPKAMKTEEQGPLKRMRAAKAAVTGMKIPPKVTSLEVEEVGRPGLSHTVYLNKPPADWESDEMAAVVEAVGDVWLDIGKAKEHEAKVSRWFGKALKAIAEALNKQNA